MNIPISDKTIFQLTDFLNLKSEQYNRPDFIENDPISIPHAFILKQDIEIMGFFASILAWGQRKTIINKCRELVCRMDGTPYDFILHHEEADLKQLLGFKHRTFNETDLLYTVDFMKRHYQTSESLETAFFAPHVCDVETALNHFRSYFFNYPDAPERTKKHISSPITKSACKRLNMFLRWMVRNDGKGVDFGIWKQISPAQLHCPLDLHVMRAALKLGLLQRDKSDWKAVLDLSDSLRLMDSEDPVKYDFALFGISIEEKCVLNV